MVFPKTPAIPIGGIVPVNAIIDEPFRYETIMVAGGEIYSERIITKILEAFLPPNIPNILVLYHPAGSKDEIPIQKNTEYIT